MALSEMDRSRLAWWTLGFALAAAVLFVLHSFVGTFVFGLFLYYATRPIYRRIRTRIRPQSLAAAVARRRQLLYGVRARGGVGPGG